MSGLVERASALRQEAWEAVKASSQYAQFKALDDAVAAMGGQSLLRKAADSEPSTMTATRRVMGVAQVAEIKKPSQGDAAATALRRGGMPLPIGRLMEAALEAGAEIGGNDPLANFRSSLSKDARFQSFRRNNMYFWWFAGEPLPLAFQSETEPDDFSDLLGSASSSSSEKGGDGHDPATT